MILLALVHSDVGAAALPGSTSDTGQPLTEAMDTEDAGATGTEYNPLNSGAKSHSAEGGGGPITQPTPSLAYNPSGKHIVDFCCVTQRLYCADYVLQTYYTGVWSSQTSYITVCSKYSCLFASSFAAAYRLPSYSLDANGKKLCLILSYFVEREHFMGSTALQGNKW